MRAMQHPSLFTASVEDYQSCIRFVGEDIGRVSAPLLKARPGATIRHSK